MKEVVSEYSVISACNSTFSYLSYESFLFDEKQPEFPDSFYFICLYSEVTVKRAYVNKG